MRIFGIFIIGLATAAIHVAALGCLGQQNLVVNPDAEKGSESWVTQGPAAVESCPNEKPCFVVRQTGEFAQKIPFDTDYSGKYVLFMARASSERIDSMLTGLPTIYGYLNTPMDEKGRVINTYMTGQQMVGRPGSVNDWVTLYGIFPVKPNTISATISFRLAERNGEPHNGSAGRFRNLGLYIFDSEEAAKLFATTFNR